MSTDPTPLDLTDALYDAFEEGISAGIEEAIHVGSPAGPSGQPVDPTPRDLLWQKSEAFEVAARLRESQEGAAPANVGTQVPTIGANVGTPTEVREALAALCHEQWSGWMEYLFSKCVTNLEPGCMILPRWAVDRWQRQMTTAYGDLSAEEKDSDRAEADRILALLDSSTPSQAEPFKVRVGEGGLTVEDADGKLVFSASYGSEALDLWQPSAAKAALFALGRHFLRTLGDGGAAPDLKELPPLALGRLEKFMLAVMSGNPEGADLVDAASEWIDEIRDVAKAQPPTASTGALGGEKAGEGERPNCEDCGHPMTYIGGGLGWECIESDKCPTRDPAYSLSKLAGMTVTKTEASEVPNPKGEGSDYPSRVWLYSEAQTVGIGVSSREVPHGVEYARAVPTVAPEGAETHASSPLDLEAAIKAEWATWVNMDADDEERFADFAKAVFARLRGDNAPGGPQ